MHGSVTEKTKKGSSKKASCIIIKKQFIKISYELVY